MRYIVSIAAVAILAIGAAINLQAQTNVPPDVSLMISNLTAEVAVLQKQAAPTNPEPVLESVTMSNGVAISTNAVPPTTSAAMSSEFQPILNLLGGKAKSSLATVLTWIAAFAALVAPWRNKIKHAISDKFNEIASKSDRQQDNYLHALFAKGWYQTVTLLLNIAGISLPTTADLDRVIEAQNEAALTATQKLLSQKAPAVLGNAPPI